MGTSSSIFNALQVALKTFVDEVSGLVVERCLIQHLPSISSHDFVCKLSDADTDQLVGESAAMAMERARVMEKLKVLEDGLAQLTQLNKRPLPAAPS